jgi:hypothetical protein
MQKQLLTPSLAQFQNMELVNPVLLKGTGNALQALQTSMTLSGLTHESIGECIGKPRETVTRFLNGNGGLSAKALESLIDESGNLFFIQYMAKKYGYEMKRIDSQALKIIALEEELEKARLVA